MQDCEAAEIDNKAYDARLSVVEILFYIASSLLLVMLSAIYFFHE